MQAEATRTQTKREMKMHAKYGTTMRDKPESVTHHTYGRTTVVLPINVMLYETAIKASFVNFFTHYSLEREWQQVNGVMRYYLGIADRNDIDLPWINGKDVTDAKCNQAAEDYHYCCRLLAELDLYHDLLD